MVDSATNLDDRRDLKARAATLMRRKRAEVEADQALLRQRREELEIQLTARPCADWHDAVDKVRYLLSLFAETPAAADPRRKKLLDAMLADFERLLRDQPSGRTN